VISYLDSDGAATDEIKQERTMVRKPKLKTCTRCGAKFDNPVPRFTNPTHVHVELLSTEIGSVDCCADCNQVMMTAGHRNNTVYFDPHRTKGFQVRAQIPPGREGVICLKGHGVDTSLGSVVYREQCWKCKECENANRH